MQKELREIELLDTENQTRTLTDYFQEKGLLLSVSADGSPEEIYQRTLDTLAKEGV